MKSRILTCITVLAAFAAIAASIRSAGQSLQAHNQEHARYKIKNLGLLGGTFSDANGLSNKGWVMGAANLEGDETQHAVLWRKGANYAIEDLGTLGGPNSAVLWSVNDDKGLIAGVSDVSAMDPNGEDFCGLSPSGFDPQICLGFLWQKGRMTPLPTLGGNNSYAFAVNNHGQVAGIAETSTQDPNCIAPQVLDYRAVIWGNEGEIQKLRLLPGDTVAGATAINDRGQAVGGSGVCIPISALAHAVLWQNGSVTNLGSLGGALNNTALAINNHGQVVGDSDLPGDTTTHAFLWTKARGMRDLGTVSGDFASFPYAINSKGQVVGDSCDESGNCRAFLWQDGVMTDLNTLIPPNSSLYLLVGNNINDEGEIAALACVISNGACTGETRAVLVIPTHYGSHSETDSSTERVGGNLAPKITESESIRKWLQQRRGLGRIVSGATRQQ
jgi:probable HAF family extracellular repeat protein